MSRLGRELKQSIPNRITVNLSLELGSYLRFRLDIEPQKTLTAILTEILERERANDPRFLQIKGDQKKW